MDGSAAARARRLLLVLLLVCLATRLWFLAVLPWCAEDAYITFRYAAHWAQGLGPVFNPGEREWGFTSPLWTALLALAAWVHLPVEGAARALLTACDLASLGLAFRLLARRSVLAAGACGLFFAVWPRLAQMPASGLESSLVLLLLLGAATFARTRAGGLLHGLLALSRPEGLAMSGLLATRLGRGQRVVWVLVAALQGGLMLWFGRPFPSSVSSKAMVYGVQARGLQWFEWLVPGSRPQTADGLALAPAAIVLLAGLVAAVVRWRRRATRVDDAPLPLLCACGLAVLTGYTLLGVPWFYWYAPAPMVTILLAVFLGLATQRVLRWALVLLFAFVVVAWPGVSDTVVRTQTHDAAVFAGIGRTLREDAAGRDAAVMLEPIGIIGWTSGLRVVDEVGLVTPWVAEERARGDGWYARVVARAHPDYLVYRKYWLDGNVAWAGVGAPFTSRAQQDSVTTGYEVVRRRAGGPLPSGAGRLLILRRRATPPPPAPTRP